MLERLLLGQLASPQQLLDQRVVLGQPRQLAVSEQVRAAVADVSDRDMVTVEIGGGQRGPHARAIALGLGALVDLAVRPLDDDGQPFLGGAVLRQTLRERLDGDLRCDLAGLRATHAVGDHEHGRAGVARSPRCRGAGGPCRCAG